MGVSTCSENCSANVAAALFELEVRRRSALQEDFYCSCSLSKVFTEDIFMLACFSKFLKVLQTVIFVVCTEYFVMTGDTFLYIIYQSLYACFLQNTHKQLCFSSIYVPVLLSVPVILRGQQP